MTVSYGDVKNAACTLLGHATHTPVVSSRTLNALLGAEVFFKCENFQRVGAFKFRGAFNALSQLTDAQKSQGVIAYSSGNHAQAVALSGQLLSVPTTIVMPNNAPRIKRAATAAYGAKIVTYDPNTESREEVAEQINRRLHVSIIPPFNHPDIIAGQGTAAMELLDEIPNLESVLVPCGGGGLLSGSALAVKAHSSSCSVVGIEPELADDACQSFFTGKIQTIAYPMTIADGTRTLSVGELTFEIMQNYVDDMVSVSEASICKAVQWFFERMKLVVEPSGALGLAALLSNTVPARGKIGIIISGGNMDAASFQKVMESA